MARTNGRRLAPVGDVVAEPTEPVVGSAVPAFAPALVTVTMGRRPGSGPENAETERSVVETQAKLVMVQAQHVTITTQADCEHAADIIREIKSRKARWLEVIEPLVKSAAENHKRTVALRDSLAKPLDEAERLVKARVGGFLAEQERQRREAEAAAQAEAQRQAEAEQAAEAEALEAAGQHEAAAAVALAPVEAPVVIAAPIAKPAGLSTVTTWHFVVDNPLAVPREYLSIDDRKIGAVVRALKGAAKIPGVRVYSTEEVRSRS